MNMTNIMNESTTTCKNSYYRSIDWEKVGAVYVRKTSLHSPDYPIKYKNNVEIRIIH